MDAIKLLGSLMGNKSLSSGLGGKLLGGLLGGGRKEAAPQSSGLAGILGGMLGGGGKSSGGMMSGLLGSVLGGGSAAGLLGKALGGGGGQAQQPDSNAGDAAGGVAGMMGGMMAGAAEAPNQQEYQQANDQAVLMIRAMVNAAKSDGRIDQAEQENIISKLGDDVSQAEVDFLKQEFAAPIDVASFARSIPNGLEQQIYALSLTSIELDTQNEANYLGQLAQGLNIDANLCNQIHDHLGAPKIFN